jgi:hypothetical protein
MRKLALFLLSALPSTLAVALPSGTRPNTSLEARPIRISLVNLSGERRQIALVSGTLLDLPVGMRVDIDSHVGATLFIVSDTHRSIDDPILIKSGDDARLLAIR